jgi:hypothetical protein
MAFVELFAGKVSVNVLVAALSEPKSNTATDAFVVLLYINAPLQVKLAGFHTALEKDTYAVYVWSSESGGITVNVLPPAV